METLPNNILEPIDPLDISFSQDKCVKTPETCKSNKKSSSSCSKSLIKNSMNLFDCKINSTQLTRSPPPKIKNY